MALTPAEIAQIRPSIGTDRLDTALLAAQLLEMVEKLQGQLAAAEGIFRRTRDEVATQVAGLEERLSVAALAGNECPRCAETRATLARLRRALAP